MPNARTSEGWLALLEQQLERRSRPDGSPTRMQRIEATEQLAALRAVMQDAKRLDAVERTPMDLVYGVAIGAGASEWACYASGFVGPMTDSVYPTARQAIDAAMSAAPNAEAAR
jgi:hypothetical protein